jgi:hypothetical protein
MARYTQNNTWQCHTSFKTQFVIYAALRCWCRVSKAVHTLLDTRRQQRSAVDVCTSSAAPLKVSIALKKLAITQVRDALETIGRTINHTDFNTARMPLSHGSASLS